MEIRRSDRTACGLIGGAYGIGVRMHGIREPK
jgi:hypothetical protein